MNATIAGGAAKRSEATAKFHAARASQLYAALPRESGVMPEVVRPERFRRWLKTSERVAKIVFWAFVVYDIYLFVR